MQKVKEIFNSSDKHADTPATANSQSLNGLNGTSGTSSSTHSPASKLASEVENVSAHNHTAAQPRQEVAEGVPAHGHDHLKHSNLEGVKDQTHDHKHLAAVAHERQHEHTVEEVQRERTHDRHVHHVQHHVQPVLDEQHREEQHHEKVHPVTQVKESHVNTKDDIASFAALNKHKDTVQAGEKSHTVVDKGEIVNENVSHHVHHVVQPVIERDTHEHHVIHTKIPVHHTTHEAPIIHQSSTHEPMHISDFVKGGGDLKSNVTHDQAGVLATGDCERASDGPAETLAQKLHLK